MQPEAVVFIFLLGYVMGSFPTAYIVARLKGVDIFQVGSGNMGANNVIRAVGWQYGAVVWFVDGAKGALAIMLARWLVPDHSAAAGVLAAIAAVTGERYADSTGSDVVIGVGIGGGCVDCRDHTVCLARRVDGGCGSRFRISDPGAGWLPGTDLYPLPAGGVDGLRAPSREYHAADYRHRTPVRRTRSVSGRL
jgi:hypothetical protein